MAWVTRDEAGMYNQAPQTPDWETLAYWVQRMEPLVGSRNEQETIIVFCNRCGTEDDVV